MVRCQVLFNFQSKSASASVSSFTEPRAQLLVQVVVAAGLAVVAAAASGSYREKAILASLQDAHDDATDLPPPEAAQVAALAIVAAESSMEAATSMEVVDSDDDA